MKLAAYARYSSDTQRAESIEEQFREIDEWAAHHKHTIVRRYSDYALSGKYDHRPGFGAMIQDAAQGFFEAVVVFDLSRFSRGGEYGIIDALRLSEHNVQLLSVTESYGDDFGGKLIKHIKFLMAEEKINELRLNVARGQKDNALKAKHNGGTPPLGYDLGEDGKLVINEREAEAVKIIFSLFAAGRSYTDICQTLNERGYKTKRNSDEFRKNSLHDILINRKYIGVYEFGKVNRQKLARANQGKKSRIVLNENPIAIEGGCPAIIDKALWDKVQERLGKRKQTNPAAKANYLLKGKVICGCCGANFVGTVKGSEKAHFYECASRKIKQKKCTNRSVGKDRLEKAVIGHVRASLFSPHGKKVLREYIKEYNKELDKNQTALKEYRSKVKSLEMRLARAREGFLLGLFESAEVAKVKREVDLHMKELSPPPEKKIKNVNLDKLLSKLETQINEDEDLLVSLVEKVVITGEDIDVYLYKSFLHDDDPEDGPPNDPESDDPDQPIVSKRKSGGSITGKNRVEAYLHQKQNSPTLGGFLFLYGARTP